MKIKCVKVVTIQVNFLLFWAKVKLKKEQFSFMNEKFFDLKKEKQDRMINGALEVFGKNGYRHASTDEMVQKAGISKGLLFHYFGSKLGLYEFAYDYSVRYILLELSSAVDDKETDFYKLFLQVTNAYAQALKTYPYMLQFMDKALTEDVSEALLAIEEKRGLVEANISQIWARADRNVFLPEVDFKKLYQLLLLVTKGLARQRLESGELQPDLLLAEIKGYLDMLQTLTVKKAEPVVQSDSAENSLEG